MKTTVMLLFSILSSYAFAQSVSNDFSRTTNKSVVMTEKSLRQQLEITGEIFELDDTGAKLLSQKDEIRVWQFGSDGDLVSNWSFSSPDTKPLAIQHTWKIEPNGSLRVHFKQFDSMIRDGRKEVKLGKLIKEEEVRLKDFNSFTWTVDVDSKKKTVLRFTPRLRQQEGVITANEVPVILDEAIIYDKNEHVWAEGVNSQGKYLAVTTHLGTVVMSYFPFKSAKEIGFSIGNKIQIETNAGPPITVMTNTRTVGGSSRVKVYGMIFPKRTTTHPKKVMVFAGSSEESFLNMINN